MYTCLLIGVFCIYALYSIYCCFFLFCLLIIPIQEARNVGKRKGIILALSPAFGSNTCNIPGISVSIFRLQNRWILKLPHFNPCNFMSYRLVLINKQRLKEIKYSKNHMTPSTSIEIHTHLEKKKATTIKFCFTFHGQAKAIFSLVFPVTSCTNTSYTKFPWTESDCGQVFPKKSALYRYSQMPFQNPSG